MFTFKYMTLTPKPSPQNSLLLCLVFSVGAGCSRPPPAPEGLDDSVRYLVREFYSDDETVGSGLTGLMNWFDEEGYSLLNEGADYDTVGAFSLEPLTGEEVLLLDLDNDGRDLTKAAGIVSVAGLQCDWTETETLYVRSDQINVFDDTFEDYKRTYMSSRPIFEDATSSHTFTEVEIAFDPLTEELTGLESSFLFTENIITTSTLGITIVAPVNIHFRHGSYLVQERDLEVSLVLSYTTERADGESGNNSLIQSYSLVVNIQTEDGETLRLFSIWNELESIWFESDSTLVLSAAVNKSQEAAERLSDICAGEVTLANE